MEIVPLSSETTTTIASTLQLSQEQLGALCPFQAKSFGSQSSGKIQPAASINVFCNITAPSCSGDSGLNIDNSNGVETSAFNWTLASL